MGPSLEGFAQNTTSSLVPRSFRHLRKRTAGRSTIDPRTQKGIQKCEAWQRFRGTRLGDKQVQC
eukprot:3264941-Pyramimonas_sp.AAC.1